MGASLHWPLVIAVRFRSQALHVQGTGVLGTTYSYSLRTTQYVGGGPRALQQQPLSLADQWTWSIHSQPPIPGPRLVRPIAAEFSRLPRGKVRGKLPMSGQLWNHAEGCRVSLA